MWIGGNKIDDDSPLKPNLPGVRVRIRSDMSDLAIRSYPEKGRIIIMQYNIMLTV